MSVDSRTEEEWLDESYPDQWVDVTDDVTCYEKGKTFSCTCGQGFGVEFDEGMVKCPTCNKVCVDLELDKRGPPVRDHDQSSLTEW